MKLFCSIFIGVGLLFMSIGGTLAFVQHRTIARGIAVQARVLSTDIERHTSSSSNGGSSTSYKPIVNYRYTVDGVEYQCNKVHPISYSSGYSWAQSIVRQFPAGKTVEAFYNPQNPGKAFLIRRHSFFPYLFVLFPAVFVCIGIGMAISSGASKVKPPVPLPSTGGWFEIKPAARIIDRQRASLFAMVLWDSIGLIACGHFFMVAQRPYGLMAIIATSIYAGIGCIPLAMMLYYALLRRTTADARLFVMSDTVTRGEPLTIGARQTFLRPITLERVEIGFRCMETTKTRSGNKTSISTHQRYEQLQTVMENQSAMTGQDMEYSADITVPVGEATSTPPTSKGYPKRRWSIRLVVKIPNSPDYRSDFPVMVS